MISEVLILCEGYHDRAFWAGALLEHFRCTIAPQNIGNLNHRDAKGVYHYQTRGGRFIHVYPCQNHSSVRLVVEDKLKERHQKPFEHLLVNPDVDEGTVLDYKQALEGWLKGLCPEVQADGDATYPLDSGRVSLLCWHVPQDSVDELVRDPTDRASIPTQQTLERLACTALCAVYPGRGRNVHDFIATRVRPPTSHAHKALAMSHMAGWYADKGSADFFNQHLWQVDATRAVLVRLLAEQPAWAQVAALALSRHVPSDIS